MKRILGGSAATAAALLSVPVYEPPAQAPIAQQAPAAPVGYLAEDGKFEIFAQTYELAGLNAFLAQAPQVVGSTQKRWSGIDVYVDIGPGSFRGFALQLFATTQGVRTLVYSTVVVPNWGAGGLSGRRVVAYRSTTPERYDVVLSEIVALAVAGPSPIRVVGIAGNDLEPIVLGETSTPAFAGVGTNVIDGGRVQIPTFTSVGPVLVPGLRIRSIQASHATGGAANLYLLIGDKPLNPAAGWTDILWSIGLAPGGSFQSEVDFLGGYRFAQFPTFWVSTSPTAALGPTAGPSLSFSVMLE